MKLPPTNLALPFDDEPEQPGPAGADDPAVPEPPELGPAPEAAASSPEDLHPGLWLAHQLGSARITTTASGFAALDAELPGGGWPHRMLTELLLPHPGIGELRLLAPALAGLIDAAPEPAADGGRCVMLFDPPAGLCGWALAQLGLDARRLVVVHGREGEKGATHLRHLLRSADVLWALEQALRSGHLGAALAWLPQRLPADALRRLQLAAQVHDGPVFLFRELEARLRPSPAPLRLALQPVCFDELALRVLKRRGPPLVQPLRLALPPALQPWLHDKSLRRRARVLRRLPGVQRAGAARVGTPQPGLSAGVPPRTHGL